MSRKDKLLKRLKSLPKDFRFDELETVLCYFGFVRVKTNSGSHFKWKNHFTGESFRAPRRSIVKKAYLKILINVTNL